MKNLDLFIYFIIFVIGMCLILGFQSAYDSYLVKEAISMGVDPIKADCAIRGINSKNKDICLKEIK